MEHLRKAVYLMLFLSLSMIIFKYTRDIYMPLTMGGLIAMLFIRPSDWLEPKGWPRWLTALLLITIFLGSIALVMALLSWQLSAFTEQMGSLKVRFVEQLRGFRHWIKDSVGISFAEQIEIIKEQEKGSRVNASGLTNFALSIPSSLLDLILIVVYTYWILFYRCKIKTFLLKLKPHRNRNKVTSIGLEASGVEQHYLIRLFSMIGILRLLFGISFSLIGVQADLLFVVLCETLEIVPFVGNLVGIGITMLGVIAQGIDLSMVLAVIVAYMAAQIVQNHLLEPLTIGKHINIIPLFIMFLLIACDLVWGIPGMMVAILLLGMLKIILDRILPREPYARLIGSEKKRDIDLELI
jgi:predicted PurR-regulated permease PerM